ncbi:hypothetical protein [Nocardia noduli]|uniref:hypothetical protein n=1 Tax=Nocardia noduli TaxID=2815722 RepID=UPI001C213F5E|nr:hypothetical protein [Nocardia noduli]
MSWAGWFGQVLDWTADPTSAAAGVEAWTTLYCGRRARIEFRTTAGPGHSEPPSGWYLRDPQPRHPTTIYPEPIGSDRPTALRNAEAHIILSDRPTSRAERSNRAILSAVQAITGHHAPVPISAGRAVVLCPADIAPPDPARGFLDTWAPSSAHRIVAYSHTNGGTDWPILGEIRGHLLGIHDSATVPISVEWQVYGAIWEPSVLCSTWDEALTEVLARAADNAQRGRGWAAMGPSHAQGGGLPSVIRVVS